MQLYYTLRQRLPALSSLRLIAATAYWRAHQSVCLTGCRQGWSAIVESITMWRYYPVIFYTGFWCSIVSIINLPCSSTSLFMVLRRNT